MTSPSLPPGSPVREPTRVLPGVTVGAVSTAARSERPEGTGGASRRRGRPPAQSGDETRAAIIAVAQRLFGGRGYGGVSMEALAAECELNERALYYYFRSKRELFEAAAETALVRLGAEIAQRVFDQSSLHDRVGAYIDIFRDLHASDPDLLPFIGMVLVDWRVGGSRPSLEEAMSGPGGLIIGFLGTLVDDALARDELEPGVDREGAVSYLVAIGMGVMLASGEGGSFPAMLDVLERINDGTLYRR
jgi:AcrR family transcriptional regulator